MYRVAVFKRLTAKVGPDAGDFWEVHEGLIRNRNPLSVTWIFHAAVGELPQVSLLSHTFNIMSPDEDTCVQIVFALRAVQYPASIPVSLTTLHLVTQSVSSFAFAVYRLIDQTGSIADQVASVRKLYDVLKVPNQVVDGTLPFPEDEQKVRHGIALEFR